MVGTGTTLMSSMSATTPMMRCGPATYHWSEFQERVVPCQMMVQRTAGEYPARRALADNRDALTTLAVRLVEIASFENRQSKRGEKSGCDDPD